MTRQCGDCQLCCKLVPVPPLSKPAGKRCEFQRVGKGCLVYHRLGMPPECGVWTCRWLGDPAATAGLPRPDRAHYVIDVMPDFVTLRQNADPDAEPIYVEVIQVWIDPAYPSVTHDKALRAYLAHEAETQRRAAIMRFNSRDAITVFPPALAADGQWHEITSSHVEEQTPDRLRVMLGL